MPLISLNACYTPGILHSQVFTNTIKIQLRAGGLMFASTLAMSSALELVDEGYKLRYGDS